MFRTLLAYFIPLQKVNLKCWKMAIFFIDSLFRQAEFVFRDIKGEISDKSDEYGRFHFTLHLA